MAVLPPDSLALIASLLQADLAELRQQHARQPQAAAGSATSDEDDALALYEQELAGLVQADKDAKLARSLAAAAATDGPLFQALAREEEAAREDHRLALQLSTEVDDDGDDEPMRQDYYCRPVAPVGPQHQPRPVPVASTEYCGECIACTDTFLSSSLVHVRCKDNHAYCGACLHDLFVAATKDESLFPPRCDGAEIPLDLVKRYLSQQELFEYSRKAAEFSTPKRLYCAVATCSTFLGAASGHQVAVKCPTCQRSTCAGCKGPWHGPIAVCGASPDADAARALEREFQFKQCPSCKRVVELDSGCHHIYCRCGHEFCYLCAAKWQGGRQTCDCPLWEERRLLHAQNEDLGVAQAAAPAQVVRAVRAAAVAAPVRAPVAPPAVPQVVDCGHRHVVKIEGAGRCTECAANLHLFLLRCNDCRANLCVRCRRNRARVAA
ncbi:uncharacterized protein RHOBADRAFT_35184 [Rhodotorula graminis WP1]|uniref:RBR-type E3 ubiquitin transferase n=1 Tax=Rhodotorula graminis (strain WP1) TaxID=578459 RepID=A0A194S7M0_RHOGW|nr:uncharacterized protein RHOBADRAFT_35184 [Rhodotorula graminis WP1]KPV76549.1 hypothetical protein RHOBADRAFT_35184 [Rhodotorula graminis WP1]